MRCCNRAGFLRGLTAGIAVLAAMSLIVAVSAVLSYDGACGGFLPFTGEPRPCTMPEYMAQKLGFTYRIALYEYWYAVVAILAVPALAGLMSGARETGNRG